MDDIAERLRWYGRDSASVEQSVLFQAADEIVSLRARLAEAEVLLEALRADLDEAGKDTRRLDSGKMRFQLVTGGAWLTWTGDLRAAIDAAVREPAP